MNVKGRVEQLRHLMREQGLAGYVVPSSDPHQSEYVAATWQRRGFISGFDGSAGTVVVTLDKAGLWTDSRYFLQAEQQLAGSGIELFKMAVPGVPEMEDWLCGELREGDRVGCDPWVFSISAFEQLQAALARKGIGLHAVEDDLAEQVWGAGRPPMPTELIRSHSVEFAGRSVADKLAMVEAELAMAGADAHVLSALDEIAWTFNLRGADVPYNPVFIAFALIERGRTLLFVDLSKVGRDVAATLPPVVELRPYEAFDDALVDLGRRAALVWADPATTSWHAETTLKQAGAKVLRRTGPVPAWKSVKNGVEIACARGCHVRDGVAMARFMAWLERAVVLECETELSIGAKVEGFRAGRERFVGMSFSSIVGYGAHGAIVHYSATPESSVPVRSGNLLLVDSGAQYLDGTTDITRTVALGEPTEEQKRAYTAVLKGHLLLGRTQFPEGTNGYQLDVLARQPLWALGLNYGHGTGHGVGAALCVHEGPFSVSLRRNLTPLAAGNVLSNEPGFYKTDGFGIRIENLVLVVEKEVTSSGRFLGFEDLTLCPYDLNLVDTRLLCPEEVQQINRYHARVLEALTHHLEPAERLWLERACREIG
ncbi:MAG: aminopeptidase P family protein [Deltaproteobacteria bacterium]|nr:aminopeptidase P family protein [Deltaproteobacteria bacterium]